MKHRQGHIITMLCAGFLLTLCSCGEDSSDSMQQRTHELRLSFGYPSFISIDEPTRTDPVLPDYFELYVHDASLQPISQIQCYMTYEKDGNQKDIPCEFNHAITNADPPAHIWTANVPLFSLASGSSFYLYGFMPKENLFVQDENESSGVTIAPYGNPASFAKGVVMTFTGLNAVTPNDVCVIVGAKGYDGTTANIPNMSDRLGKFNYNPETEGNSLFLLVDHIYAGLKFNMALDAEYAKLRGITVKNVKLKPEDGNNNVIESVDAVVTIAANDDNQDLMSVSFPEDNFKRGKGAQSAVLYDGEGRSLSTDNQEFMACLCPNTNTKFILEITYDVYDSKRNLIREDQTARNAISLKHDLTAGKMHIVNIVVKPTYLYVLSDPDLDDITFVVGN